MPVPTTFPKAVLSVEREDEIQDALQADPKCFLSWEATV
jgi:hypothetical protein